MSHKILVADSDRKVADAIKAHLMHKRFERQFEPICAYGGHEAIQKFLQEFPAAIIVRDVMADLSGLDVAQRVREVSDVPILFFSDRKDRHSLERALSIGDDFMTQPWNWDRVAAKLNTILKRRPAPVNPELFYNDGRLKIDFANRQVMKDDRLIQLTDTEFKLLSYFVRKADQVLSYNELLSHIWGHTYAKAKSHISRYVGSLRKQLEDDPANPIYFRTERGIGYFFKSHPSRPE
jgi:two-component system KDP operon response regulator KdpE